MRQSGRKKNDAPYRWKDRSLDRNEKEKAARNSWDAAFCHVVGAEVAEWEALLAMEKFGAEARSNDNGAISFVVDLATARLLQYASGQRGSVSRREFSGSCVRMCSPENNAVSEVCARTLADHDGDTARIELVGDFS